MLKSEIILEDLNCASCIDKIEKQTQKLNGVDSSKFNFVSETLIIEHNDDVDKDKLFKNVKKIVLSAEPDVLVRRKQDRSEDSSHIDNSLKVNILRFGISALLLLSSYILKLEDNVKLIVLLVAYTIVGYDVVIRAFKNIFKGEIFDENFLMSIATFGAIGIGEYPEAVAVMLFYQVGEIFQNIAVGKSRRSIKSLIEIRPEYANLEIDGQLKKVDPEDVLIGDTIIVKPGEKVPLDGIIIKGSSMVNTSALTGESALREVYEDDEILSGFVNENGLLTIGVTKEFSESAVSKILDLVENASAKKAPTENFITKFARYYTPIVVILALVVAFVTPLVLGEGFYKWIYRSLVFLVISCPCALVVSVPLGFFGGIGAASRSGILIKGGNYLEALNDVDTIVMDKTGTLTRGIFKVTEIIVEDGYNESEVLEFAALGEIYSNHPIATSIKKAYEKHLNENKIENYEEIPGYGVKTKIQDKDILIGNIKLMNRENIEVKDSKSTGTVIYVSVDKEFAGKILIADEIKEDSKGAIEKFHDLGITKTIMLTGDNKEVASKIANELNLDEVYSELLPEDKVTMIEKLNREKSHKGKLAFIGDGINDAPVLAISDVGVAMGGVGSDAAIEAADIVIMNDEPSKLATAIKIARKTKKIVMQNIVLALTTKILVMILGVMGIANMWIAVFADVGVAVIAILNSMRALKLDK